MFGKGTRRKRKTPDFENMPDQEKREYFKSKLLNYLSRRKTRKEALDYLKRIQCEEDLAEELADFAESYRFLDDEQYAHDFIQDAISLRHHSRKQIRYDMMMKGLDRNLIDQVLEEENPDDQASALYLAKKRLSEKTYTKEEEAEQIEKCKVWLSQKGFSYADISNAIDNLEEKL